MYAQGLCNKIKSFQMQLSSCERIILFSPYRVLICAQVKTFTWRGLSLSWPGHSQWSQGG